MWYTIFNYWFLPYQYNVTISDGLTGYTVVAPCDYDKMAEFIKNSADCHVVASTITVWGAQYKSCGSCFTKYIIIFTATNTKCGTTYVFAAVVYKFTCGCIIVVTTQQETLDCGPGKSWHKIYNKAINSFKYATKNRQSAFLMHIA